VSEIIDLTLTKFTDESIAIIISLLVILLVLMVVYWLYNRRQFQQLSHQIPASVLKNYLDSIIQNSNALKSSLFRGGGLELGEGIPSVMPVADLGRGSVQQGDPEEVKRLGAEIAQLKSTVSEKEQIIMELEDQLRQMESVSKESGSADDAKHKKEIETLKKEIESIKSETAGAGDETAKQLVEITSERDELKDKLIEYEIIEEDLANLKRLQHQNEELKKSLAALKGEYPTDEQPSSEDVDQEGDDSSTDDETERNAAIAEQLDQVASEGEAEEEPEASEEAAEEPEASEEVAEEPEASEEVAEEPAASEEAAEEPASEEAAEEPAASSSELPPEVVALEKEIGAGSDIPEPDIPEAEVAGGEDPVDVTAEADGDDGKPEEGDKSAEELLGEFEKMLG